MYRLYAIIWALIFGFSGEYLIAANNVVLNILGFISLAMCGLSVYTLYKSFKG